MCVSLQVTSTMVTVRRHQQRALQGLHRGSLLFYSTAVSDATSTHHHHRRFQVADEQSTGRHHVNRLRSVSHPQLASHVQENHLSGGSTMNNVWKLQRTTYCFLVFLTFTTQVTHQMSESDSQGHRHRPTHVRLKAGFFWWSLLPSAKTWKDGVGKMIEDGPTSRAEQERSRRTAAN